jgi:hypothetical protein
MNKPGVPGGGNSLVVGAVCLVLLVAIAPALVALAGALLPLVIALAVAAIAVRLVFFHTRRW